MLFNFGISSTARVFGIDVFGDHYEKWWWHLTIWPIYSCGRAVRNGIMWTRCRIDPKHRYHVIRTGLEPGYYDIDHIMLHGMFSLLRRYVEDEHDGAEALEKWAQELLSETETHIKDVNVAQGQKEMEAVTLYLWWTEDYPSMLSRTEELMDILYGGDGRITWSDAGEIDGESVMEMHVRDFEGEEIEWKKELDSLEARIAEEEQEMLHRLIDIRSRLWT